MNKRTRTRMPQAMGVFAALLMLVAAASGQTEEPKPNQYGARDPIVCKDKKAPAKGAITASLAAKYVNCERDRYDGQYLYLVENITVQVGASRPCNPKMDTNVPEIDVRFPLFPIRGSLVSYQCHREDKNYTWMMPGKNCTKTVEPEAKGFCYRTTFAEWRCHMWDTSSKNENYFQYVAPPKP